MLQNKYISLKLKNFFKKLFFFLRFQKILVYKSKIVNLFLEKGADIKAKDNYDETALHIAASSGRSKLEHLLLKKGADFEAKDNDDMTALYYALLRGEFEILNLLLKKGANNKLKTMMT